jgi:DNA-binding beta-propeller fold protein YncE
MRHLGIVVIAAALMAFGCQQARVAKPHHRGVYSPPDGVIPLDGRPSDILHHGGRLYVTSFRDRRLWVIDPTSGKELGRFENFDHYSVTVDERDEEGNVTGQREERRRARVGSMAVAKGKLFVEQIFCDSLLVFDADTVHPIGRIEVGGGGKMVASPDERRLYFARNSKKGFCIVDVDTYQKNDIPYPRGAHGIGAIAVSRDGERLYLGIQRGAREAGAEAPSEVAGPVNPLTQTHTGPLLAVYDLADEKYVALKSIGDTLKARGDDSSIPAAFALSSDSSALYIAMRQCTAGVHVFDTTTNELRKPTTFASVHEAFPWPNCSDIACADGKIYVTVGSNHELVVLAANTRHKFQSFALGGYGSTQPGPLAVSADRVFICQQGLRRLSVVNL